MVRKTKSESELTRQSIIAAARKVFAQHGVSRTTLAQIAKAAQVSRGAIYWHFKNKPDLFFAVLEQLSLPLIDRMDECLFAPNTSDPLRSIQSNLIEILELMENDEAARATFEIITLKCEYVDEFSAVDTKVLTTGCDFMQRLTQAYEDARARGLLRGDFPPPLLALETYTFMKGLVRIWLSDTQGNIIRKSARALIEAHIALRYAPALDH